MLEVIVTREHIDAARKSPHPDRSNLNPIARAICDALGEPVGKVLTLPEVRKIVHTGEKEAPCEPALIQKLDEWRRHMKMEPFSFTVDL